MSSSWANAENAGRSAFGWLRLVASTTPSSSSAHRPHRSLPHRSTPAVAYTTRPRAQPGNNELDTEFRVRHDRIQSGRVSLRINGNMHHIGLGRTLDGTRVIMLIDHHDIRIIHATTGEIIRTLTIDPNHRYHGTGRPPGGPKGPRKIRRTKP